MAYHAMCTLPTNRVKQNDYRIDFSTKSIEKLTIFNTFYILVGFNYYMKIYFLFILFLFSCSKQDSHSTQEKPYLLIVSVGSVNLNFIDFKVNINSISLNRKNYRLDVNIPIIPLNLASIEKNEKFIISIWSINNSIMCRR